MPTENVIYQMGGKTKCPWCSAWVKNKFFSNHLITGGCKGVKR